MNTVQHIAAQTYHGRRGATNNAFRYSIDYVMFDPERPADAPEWFAHNRRAVMSVQDRDHGGAPHEGEGASWARKIVDGLGLGVDLKLKLLTQPRVLGYVFNPVSFWLAYDSFGQLRVVIAEVTNTFGDRHSYLCHRDDLGAIGPLDWVSAQKSFHVSPFQPIEGHYRFRFRIDADRVDIVIDYRREGGGLVATLNGSISPLNKVDILKSMIRRPLGARRVMALIYWQALKLKLKGARYRMRPKPPVEEVSR